MSRIIEISKTRFDAFSYARSYTIDYTHEELEWYQDKDTNLFGIVLHDLTDLDFSYVVLGRDARGVFRAIDLNCSYELKKMARTNLHIKMEEYLSSEKKVFEQGDERDKKNLILEPLVTEEKLHHHFLAMTKRPGYSCAKELITEISFAFRDPDMNYIREFQTNGFNARLWELFLFALFHENGFEINRDHTAPDFHLSKFGENVFVEALTANPGHNMPSMPTTTDEIFKMNEQFMPIRFSNALTAKLNREIKGKIDYWNLEHVKGNPLIFAIHDYTWDNSMTWSKQALETYLYGFEHVANKNEDGSAHVEAIKIDNHEWETKKITSGFFNLPKSENVSAVLFSNNGTLTKFNRMGYMAGFGDQRVKMVRKGWTYESSTGKRENYVREVTSDKYSENWSEGVMMYHNPNAINTIPPSAFPLINHLTIDDEGDFLLMHFQPKFTVESVTEILFNAESKKNSKG